MVGASPGRSAVGAQDAHMGVTTGSVNPSPVKQDGVGQEVVRVDQVSDAARREVVVRLRGRSGRNGGGSHQVGVGLLFAREKHHWFAGRGDRVDPVLPGATAAEDPDDDQIGVAGQIRDLVEDDPRWIGDAERCSSRGGGDEVGIEVDSSRITDST